jgi:SAM-dependent methyltransferase
MSGESHLNIALRAYKNRFLALPWIYDHLRPLIVGGIDLHGLAAFCSIGPSDRVFDLGCGTAQLLKYLRCEQYLGVDLDLAALRRASRFASPNIRFLPGDGWDTAFRELSPTVALLIGVVHHVSDEDFLLMIDRLRACAGSLQRIVALEVSYFPRAFFNNFLSRLDRGCHVRRPEEYEELFGHCDLRIQRKGILPTRLGFVRYVGYHLAFA